MRSFVSSHKFVNDNFGREFVLFKFSKVEISNLKGMKVKVDTNNLLISKCLLLTYLLVLVASKKKNIISINYILFA